MVAVALATTGAQLTLWGVYSGRWRARTRAWHRLLADAPTWLVTVLAIVAVGGAAAWPVAAGVTDALPAAALNALFRRAFGVPLPEVTVLLLYIPAFAGLVPFRRVARK